MVGLRFRVVAVAVFGALTTVNASCKTGFGSDETSAAGTVAPVEELLSSASASGSYDQDEWTTDASTDETLVDDSSVDDSSSVDKTSVEQIVVTTDAPTVVEEINSTTVLTATPELDLSTLIATSGESSAATSEASAESSAESSTEDLTVGATKNATEAPVETPAPSVVVVIDDTTSTSSASTSTTTATPNWVGPTIGDASDSACYRETHSMGTACPLGYSDDTGSCWAQCPLSYPVECGMECIPQNNDCLLEVLAKIETVATVALNAATSGVFGQISAASKAVQLGVSCGKQLFTVAKSVTSYMRSMQSVAGSDEAEMITTLSQADVVLVDLPVAVATCLGLTVPTDTASTAKSIINGAEEIVKVIVESDGNILSSAESFISAISNVTAGASVSSLGSDDVTTLQELINTGSDCGANLKTLSDKAVIAVAQLRTATPGISTDDLRASVSTSDLVLKQIPSVTNECMGELLESVTSETAYLTRDTIRTTFGVILEQLITTGTTDGGSSADTLSYLADIADMGLGVISTFDPTGIAAMVAEFIQPICGPTSFLGEIDDGSLEEALGLTTVDDAFSGSYGTWTKAGDGAVTIIFESTDSEDVTVVIHSGGDTVEEVEVASGETVTWTSTVAEMQDKTLYLDRWRPGFLGIPGSGGGSLLMWIPRSTEGGHVELHAKINVS